MQISRTTRVGAGAVAAAMLASTGLAHAAPRKDADAHPASNLIRNEPTGSSQEDAAKASPVRYIGSGPFICSPSGFGKRSKCFQRSSLRGQHR